MERLNTGAGERVTRACPSRPFNGARLLPPVVSETKRFSLPRTGPSSRSGGSRAGGGSTVQAAGRLTGEELGAPHPADHGPGKVRRGAQVDHLRSAAAFALPRAGQVGLDQRPEAGPIVVDALANLYVDEGDRGARALARCPC